MAEQTIQLSGTHFTRQGTDNIYWLIPDNARTEIITGLTPNGVAGRYLQVAQLRDLIGFVGHVSIGIEGVTGTLNRFDLSDEFEANGSVEITIGSVTYIFPLAGADTAEPYRWSPTGQQADVRALIDAAGQSNQAATITLRDFVPAPAVSVVHARSASFTLGAPGFSALVGKTVHTGATLTTIPTQDGTEYIRILLTMGTGTPTGSSLNITASQSYVTQTGDAQFFDSGSSLILNGIQPHEPGSATGAVRLRNTGGGFKPWRDAQARTPKLLYASSADGNTVRQATEGSVGGGYWNWFITGLPSTAQVGVGDTINLVIYVPPAPVVLRDIATGIHHRRAVILSRSWQDLGRGPRQRGSVRPGRTVLLRRPGEVRRFPA